MADTEVIESKTAKEPEAHPATEIFPLLGDVALGELAEDIKAHGLRQPIWTHKGKVLDGRNRWRACLMAGVDPGARTAEWEGKDPVAFVISQNLKRRHLDASQLAMVAVKIAELYEAEAKVGRPKNGVNLDPVRKRSAVKAAEAVGVSNGYVKQAKAIEKASPELAEEVKAGKKSIPEAQRELREKAARGAKLPEALLRVKNKTIHPKNTVEVIEELLKSSILKDHAESPVVKEFMRLWARIAEMHAEFVGAAKPVVTKKPGHWLTRYGAADPVDDM